jgi:LITAF-like zinc ribbon domain
MEDSGINTKRLENRSPSVLGETALTSILDQNSDRVSLSKSKNRQISFGSPSKFGNTSSFISPESYKNSTSTTPTTRLSLSLSKDYRGKKTSLKRLSEKFVKISEDFAEKKEPKNEMEQDYIQGNGYETGRETGSVNETKFFLTDRSTFAKHSVDEFELSEYPTLRWCAYCAKETTTEVKYQNSSKTLLTSAGICMMGGVLGCFLIPYMTNTCKDIKYLCKTCKRKIDAKQ